MNALRSAPAKFVAALAVLALLGAGVGLYAYTAQTTATDTGVGQPTVTAPDSGPGCCHHGQPPTE
jgi:hypothetical protein